MEKKKKKKTFFSFLSRSLSLHSSAPSIVSKKYRKIDREREREGDKKERMEE